MPCLPTIRGLASPSDAEATFASRPIRSWDLILRRWVREGLRTRNVCVQEEDEAIVEFCVPWSLEPLPKRAAADWCIYHDDEASLWQAMQFLAYRANGG